MSVKYLYVTLAWCPVLYEAPAQPLPPLILTATLWGELSSTNEETEVHRLEELHNVTQLVTKSQDKGQGSVPRPSTIHWGSQDLEQAGMSWNQVLSSRLVRLARSPSARA